MIYDVIIKRDRDKTITLYNFLKSVRCSNLLGSNLLIAYQGMMEPAYAYRIYVDSKNKYKYFYSMSMYENFIKPVEFYEFMERTVKL